MHSFLAYAETGQLRIDGATGSIGEPESDFEVAVIRALESAGFACVAQLGFAGFRLDVVVRDPHQPTRYLLAVECDGATYHSSRSARERDRLRQEILEGLGWEVMRIWSTNWYRDPELEIRRIVDRLNRLLEFRSPPTEGAADAQDIHVDRADGSPPIQHPPIVPPTQEPVYGGMDGAAVGTPIVGGRTVEDIRAELVRIREEEIHAEMPNADRARGFLRKAMLDTLLRYRPTNSDEFRRRVPEALRAKTDPQQYLRYAGRVFDLLAEIAEPESAAPDAAIPTQFALDMR